MKHIIISDTHAPICIEKAFAYTKEVVAQDKDIDAIVINGDLLGVFSMNESLTHKNSQISSKQKMAYLKSCAPKFTEKLRELKYITPSMIVAYVQERYDWVITILKNFIAIKKTIFNMGNHESPLHFLVLQELPFLINCSQEMLQKVDEKKLHEIFQAFEKEIYALEKTHDFVYIRDKVYVSNNTLIMGIPGESHGTSGTDPASVAQEEKTKELITLAKKQLPLVTRLLIYNHTQASYDRETAHFQTASRALKKFLEEIPVHITQRVYVQSHNHWRFTQFLKIDGYHYILNNAGLHDGIFNILEITDTITCFDADPNHKKIVEVKAATPHPIKSREEVVARHYEDTDYIAKRRQGK